MAGALTASGGRSVLKRDAIAGAALRLFVRDGYSRTSVDAIAAEAGVSKRTLYNHYGDKENLFLSVIRDTFSAMISTTQRIMDAHLAEPAGVQPDMQPDVEQRLIAFAREAALTVFRAPERLDLIRLMLTEAPHFPELLAQPVRPASITGGLATRLAALASAGHLEISDPQEAAGHLFALTFGQINNRSLFGVIPISDAEMDRFVTGGVRAFLRAYRPLPG